MSSASTDNTDKIVAFDSLKVKSIDVIARTYFYGNKLYHGIISYSTYEGDLANFELDPGSTILEYDGLQLLREFYSPAYDLGKNVHSPLPDRRNVLFWSPDCRTDQRGRGQVSFYTSDLPGNYAIVIQGINSKGYAVKTVKFIEVIK